MRQTKDAGGKKDSFAVKTHAWNKLGKDGFKD